MESKFKCPACHQPLQWVREGDFGIICCENLKCIDEMIEGAAGQSQIEARHELREIYEQAKE